MIGKKVEIPEGRFDTAIGTIQATYVVKDRIVLLVSLSNGELREVWTEDAKLME
jgi:hypothetical protein